MRAQNLLITALAFFSMACSDTQRRVAPINFPEASVGQPQRMDSASVSGPTRLPASWCGKTFNPPPRRAAGGMALRTQVTNQGTMVLLASVNPRLKRIEYKIDNGSFTDTGPGPSIDPRTGEADAAPFFMLPQDLDPSRRHDITLRWKEISGASRGPVTLQLDLPFEVQKETKNLLEGGLAGSWVAFSDFYDGRRLLYFGALLTRKQAICEIRYSLDSPALDQTLNFVPSADLLKSAGIDEADPDPIEVPPTTQTVYVQLTYLDGTKSPVKKFDQRYARAN